MKKIKEAVALASSVVYTVRFYFKLRKALMKDYKGRTNPKWNKA